MLYPQTNDYRQVKDLSGFWDFRFDPENKGYSEGWDSGLDHSRPIAVPASWNDQFESNRDDLGPAWYQTTFDVPWGWQEQKIFLRFGSVNYLAEVWLNGQKIGIHEGGHLPFEFDISLKSLKNNNLLVIRVDGELSPDRVPPGNTIGGPEDVFLNHIHNYPPTFFDFFPFCGIHRPVLLYAIPTEGIKDITVITDINDENGVVKIDADFYGSTPNEILTMITGYGVNIHNKTIPSTTSTNMITIEVPSPALWEPEHPNLYDFSIVTYKNGEPIDQLSLKIGIRTVKIEGDQILLNGKPIQLMGFGRHEDFPISGRGYNPAVIIKDFALMKWVGANSFRTTHYPYSEQMMDLADRLGFLVIDETPAVGLFFREDGLDKRLNICKQMTREMIKRDKNHPCVIAWSLANEPHSNRDTAKPFFRTLYDLARKLDPSRPITIVSHLGLMEESFEFLDLVCLNRYHGWYMNCGKIEEGVSMLSGELDMIHDKFAKPILLSEFGADAIPGVHAQPPEMFSEEYQVSFLRRYLEVTDNKPFIIGQQVWNLCDFKTGQSTTRMGGMNYKGVFTRDRRPKMAAHFLREYWN